MRSTKFLIIIAMIAIGLTISVGYASLTTDITRRSKSNNTDYFDVNIKSVEITNKAGNVINTSPSYDDTSVTFSPEMYEMDDSITYKITIKNEGTKSAILEDIILDESLDGASEIIYSNTVPSLVLEPGETTYMTVTATYDVSSVDYIADNNTKTAVATVTYVEN